MSDVITPPSGDLEVGFNWTNPTTGVEYEWNGSRWIIVSSTETIDLERVLDNGNVASKGFALTNLENDAILVSPEQARLMIGGVGENVVPRFELRHETGFLDTSIVALELDEDGERFDIECEEKVDNIHFRFGNEVKLELNKKGDAVFGGKVQAEAATLDEEVVNFGQLKEDQLRQDKAIIVLENEIEQIAPSFARGTWIWDDGDGYADAGEYVMRGTQTQESRDAMLEPFQQTLTECLASAGSPSDQSVCTRAYDDATADIPQVGEGIVTYDWELCNEIEFSNYDSQGNLQSFSNVEVGQILDMICPDGSFMTAEITKVTAGQWYENPVLEFTPITTKGDANGLTKLKIFSIDDAVDVDGLDNFVRKSGDTMEGTLDMDGNNINNVKDMSLQRNVNFRTNDTDRFVTFANKKFDNDGYYGVRFDLTHGYTFNSRWQIICENTMAVPVMDISGGGTPNILGTADQIRLRGRKRNPDYDADDPDSKQDLTSNNITVKHNETKIFNLPKVPDYPHGAVSQEYVDEETTKLSEKVDEETAKLDKKVDDETAKLSGQIDALTGGEEPDGLFINSWWELDMSMDRSEVTSGKFYADTDDFYMARSTSNGNTWGPSATGSRTTNAWVTIYSKDGKLMHTYEVNKINFKEKYGKKYITEFSWAWDFTSNTLVNGEKYRIVVPGFLT